MIGGTLGTLLCGMKSYHLGRKKTVLITQLVSISGALCILFSKDVAIFYLGNFLLGYTNGVFIGKGLRFIDLRVIKVFRYSGFSRGRLLNGGTH